MMGLIDADTGRILVGERELPLANANDLRHLMGNVIQDGGLFPHLTAAGTSACGPASSSVRVTKLTTTFPELLARDPQIFPVASGSASA